MILELLILSENPQIVLKHSLHLELFVFESQIVILMLDLLLFEVQSDILRSKLAIRLVLLTQLFPALLFGIGNLLCSSPFDSVHCLQSFFLIIFINCTNQSARNQNNIHTILMLYIFTLLALRTCLKNCSWLFQQVHDIEIQIVLKLLLFNLQLFCHFKAMMAEDCERIEKELHFLHGERETLRLVNSELTSQINHLREKISALQLIVNSNPISQVTKQLEPLSAGNIQFSLEEKIAAQAYQIAYLQQLVNDKNAIVSESHSRVLQLEQNIQQMKLKEEDFEYRLKDLAAKLRSKQKESDNWKQRTQRANSERSKLINEKGEIQQKLKKQQSRNYKTLLDMGKIAVNLGEKAANSYPQNSQSNDLNEILSLQQVELEDRNQEISRLKLINGNYSETSEQSYLKNTIKHLRSELSRYSNLIGHVTEKLAEAEHTINHYSKSAEKYNKELTQLESIKKQVEQQSETIIELKQQLANKNEKYDKELKSKTQLKKALTEIIQENEFYHKLLFDIYGGNFQVFLNKQKQQFEERMNQRLNKEKWTNISQLIEANEKLRRRLKIS